LPETVDGLSERPEARNLVEIYAALAESNPQAVLEDFAGQGFGKFKPALAELLIAKLRPFAVETERLLGDPATLDAILRDGAARAAVIADPIVSEAERLVGLLKV
jgi:tryptophanyl-tRNA synthetase